MTANRFRFRVWNKKDKCFSTGLLLTRKGILKEVDFEEVAITTINQTNYELMQSTGLVDKNGKEIFEGDIIRDENNELYIVQYNTAYDIQIINLIEESWTTNLSLENNETDFSMLNHKIMWYKNYINKKVEVIGNIYENKELLE